jgi:putative tryptophan/tyrosine transport system substrate-binding protein
MNKHIRLKTLASFAIALSYYVCVFLGGCAENKPKIYRVGILSGLEYFSGVTGGFKEKLAELGYVEGRNIVYDVHKTNFDKAAYSNALKKFVNDKVDLIFVFPTEAAMQAKIETQGTGIPVVFTGNNAEEVGLIKSVREPGGDITGVRWTGSEVALRRFDIMLEIVPQAKRILIPYQRGYPIVPSQLKALHQAAEKAGVAITELSAGNAAELEIELQEQSKTINTETDVIMLIPEPLGVVPDVFAMLGKFADEHKIPFGGDFISAEGGKSIFALNPRDVDLGGLAANIADKILRGTPAGTIPLVTPEPRLRINYKRAQELGIIVPEGLLSRADEIIR